MNFRLITNRLFQIHVLYWIAFLLFFSLVWGTYDHSYYRNFMVQFLSLPARLLLVYVTLFVLIPKFFLNKKYMKFIMCFCLLLLVSAMVQRGVMIFIVEGRYLPYRSQNYFKVTELMNTVLDVNLALIIPFIYTLYQFWNKSQKEAELLKKENRELVKDKSKVFFI
ncbi:MAG: hypothetical protein AAFX55_04075 [Bacteroidota bacterium]